jgi:hypothetical protein
LSSVPWSGGAVRDEPITRRLLVIQFSTCSRALYVIGREDQNRVRRFEKPLLERKHRVTAHDSVDAVVH